MPTVRELIDRYGQPPADVALDWAWQIRQHYPRHDAGHQEYLDASHATDNQLCLLEVKPWTQLEVSEDGRLLCQAVHPAVASLALNDLQLWVDRERTALQQPSVHSAQLTQLDPLAATDQSLPPGVTRPITNRAAVSSRQLHRRKIDWSTRARYRWIGGGCLALLSVSLLLVLYWSSSKKPPQAEAIPIDSNATSNELAEHVDAGNLGVSLTELDTSALDHAATFDTPFATDMWSTPGPTTMLGQLSIESSLRLTDASQLSQDANPATASDATSQAALTDVVSPGAVSTTETVDEVEQTLKKAEASEAVAIVDSGAGNSGAGNSDDRPGRPWELLRDILRYRVTVAPKLNVTRQSQWTLAVEPIVGLTIEPVGPVTLAPQGFATWRIYEPDAKPPRACLFVRAHHRGRDGTVELIFCGGSEDMPHLSVPLAERWQAPLALSAQNQAVQLRAALARLSTTVITPEQAPLVLQRKQAMLAQLFASVRLVAIMPDLARLADLVDGQVTMHAELRAKPGEPAVATWGRVPQ